MSKARLAVAISSAVVLFGAAIPVQAAGLTEAQIQAVLGLLSSFGADATTVSNVNASLRGQATAASAQSGAAGGTVTPACVALSTNLYQGSSGSEVSKLQTFLGGSVTGYFGPATLALVQNWQASHGVAAAGTTGYGNVGPKTRAAMACSAAY